MQPVRSLHSSTRLAYVLTLWAIPIACRHAGEWRVKAPQMPCCVAAIADQCTCLVLSRAAKCTAPRLLLLFVVRFISWLRWQWINLNHASWIHLIPYAAERLPTAWAGVALLSPAIDACQAEFVLPQLSRQPGLMSGERQMEQDGGGRGPRDSRPLSSRLSTTSTTTISSSSITIYEHGTVYSTKDGVKAKSAD